MLGLPPPVPEAKPGPHTPGASSDEPATIDENAGDVSGPPAVDNGDSQQTPRLTIDENAGDVSGPPAVDNGDSQQMPRAIDENAGDVSGPPAVDNGSDHISGKLSIIVHKSIMNIITFLLLTMPINQ